MITLDEAIAPDRFEIAVTFPIGPHHREWVNTAEEAVTVARGLVNRVQQCVQITACGTIGTPHDRGFAIFNIGWTATEVIESGWHCWLPGGTFIGPVQ